MTRRLAALLLLTATLAAGCAASTDGTGQGGGAQTSAAEPDQGSPSAADPVESTVPPAEGTGGTVDIASIDPCTLVTKDEADAITGVTVLAPVLSTELCTFPTPLSGTVGQLEVFIGPGAKKYLDIDRVTLEHEFRAVPGVGDVAFAEGGAIFFKTQGIWLALRLTRLDEVDTSGQLVELATTVVGRIG